MLEETENEGTESKENRESGFFSGISYQLRPGSF